MQMDFRAEYCLGKSFAELKSEHPEEWSIGFALAESDFEVASQLGPYPTSSSNQVEYVANRVRRVMNGWRTKFAREAGYEKALSPPAEELVATIGMSLGARLTQLFETYDGPGPSPRQETSLRRPAGESVTRADESRRVIRRLQPLRGWGHDKADEVPAGDPGTSGSDGVRAAA